MGLGALPAALLQQGLARLQTGHRADHICEGEHAGGRLRVAHELLGYDKVSRAPASARAVGSEGRLLKSPE